MRDTSNIRHQGNISRNRNQTPEVTFEQFVRQKLNQVLDRQQLMERRMTNLEQRLTSFEKGLNSRLDRIMEYVETISSKPI